VGSDLHPARDRARPGAGGVEDDERDRDRLSLDDIIDQHRLHCQWLDLRGEWL
jgi:hypothetical protein